jgi:hypothetical protein
MSVTRRVARCVMEPKTTHPSGQTHPRAPHRHRLYGAAAGGLLLGGSLGYVGFVDPHNTNSAYPLCPFKWLTGWNCPFCGGLRMAHDLLHGHLAASIADNVFLLVGIPLLAGWVLLCRRRGKSPSSAPVITAMVVTAIAWTVLRNLPGFPLVPTIFSG